MEDYHERMNCRGCPNCANELTYNFMRGCYECKSCGYSENICSEIKEPWYIG